MAQEAPTAAAAPPQKSRKLIIVAASVLVLGGVGGGYWYARQGSSQPPVEAPKEPPAIVNMDPFVVNLSDPGGARFLRVTLGLVVSGEGEAKEFAEDAVARMRVRSAILEMLSQQTAAQLTKPEGKADLKKAIAARSSESAEHLKVDDVLFSEFIVQ
jgi:flagellar FliL protein